MVFEILSKGFSYGSHRGCVRRRGLGQFRVWGRVDALLKLGSGVLRKVSVRLMGVVASGSVLMVNAPFVRGCCGCYPDVGKLRSLIVFLMATLT